jgi:intraflagellar transport protein 88
MGAALVMSGQYQDAITSYETIMESQPDHQTAFNCVICYYALGDKEKIRRSFQRLVSIAKPHIEASEEYSTIDESLFAGQDLLRLLAEHKQKTIERQVLMAGKLIAGSLDMGEDSAFDWLVEVTRSSPCAEVASELEIAKASYFLHKRNFSKAIETLKTFERKESQLTASIAATNLSFLYFLEGDLEQAEKNADKAIQNDRYNARAHCNRGNCYFSHGEMELARDMYLEAINIDALCMEATFNLGLSYRELGQKHDAIKVFEKMHSILRNSPEVIWNIANLYAALLELSHLTLSTRK